MTTSSSPDHPQVQQAAASSLEMQTHTMTTVSDASHPPISTRKNVTLPIPEVDRKNNWKIVTVLKVEVRLSYFYLGVMNYLTLLLSVSRDSTNMLSLFYHGVTIRLIVFTTCSGTWRYLYSEGIVIGCYKVKNPGREYYFTYVTKGLLNLNVSVYFYLYSPWRFATPSFVIQLLLKLVLIKTCS